MFRPYAVTAILIIIGWFSPAFLKTTQIEFPEFVIIFWMLVFVVPSWIMTYPTLFVVREVLGERREEKARILENIRKSDLLK